MHNLTKDSNSATFSPDEINIQYHSCDGFTLSATTDEGDYIKTRYAGYSLEEAKELFLKEWSS